MRKGWECVTSKDIAKQILDRKIVEYEKYRKFKDKKELDEAMQVLTSKIQLAVEVNMISVIAANSYLSQLEKKYIEIMYSEQFKEYREQIINFNDDIITSRERLFIMRKQETENTKNSMKTWRSELDKQSSSGAGEGGNGREEILKNKETEREEKREDI